MTVPIGRPRSTRRVVTDAGKEAGGLEVTEEDRRRILALGRWYALSVAHLARMETDLRLWHPVLGGDPGGDVMASRKRAVRRRLGRLARVDPRGRWVGPLVEAAPAYRGQPLAYSVTSYGLREAMLPWQIKRGIYAAFIHHAWFAADIGMQVERTGGFRVLSERELATGVDHYGEDVGRRFASYYERTSGERVTKKPDLAVLSPHSDDYIAVEVERDQRKSMRWYTEKLYAYQANSRVRAVWYVCDNTTTAERVGRAATSVFGQTSNYRLRVRVAERIGDWQEVPALVRDMRLLEDLAVVDPATVESVVGAALAQQIVGT